MIKDEKTKEEIFKQISEVKGSFKFRSKCEEDLNEVVYLNKGQNVETDAESRVKLVKLNAEMTGMAKSVWATDDEDMCIVKHAK